jgi:hypothetical protein
MAGGLAKQSDERKGMVMTRSLVLVAILMTSWTAPSHAQLPGSTNPPIPLPPFLTPRGTPEDQRNCRPDAARLCKEAIGNDDAVLRCFQARRRELSPPCLAVLEKYGR